MKHTSDLRAAAAARGVLLVAHRGVWGGNVPPNTIAAYDTALAQGADMLEIDLNRTADPPRIAEAVAMVRREACEGLTVAALAARFPGSRHLFDIRFRASARP